MNDARFAVVAAATMLELVALMNGAVHPLATCVYFGENKGDYSDPRYSDEVRKALFIAVFDFAPRQVWQVDEILFSPTLQEVDDDMDTTMSA